MMLLEQTIRGYLELRLAQLDVLFAQTDDIMEDIRLLDNRPAGLIKRIYRFQRQCRCVKRNLICAECCDSADWERTRLRLDNSCEHVKNLFHQLRCQVKTCRVDKSQMLAVSISVSPNLASNVDGNPAPLENEIIINNTGEKHYAAEHPKYE